MPAGSDQVVLRRQPIIAYPHEAEHAMGRIELTDDELDAFQAIARWSTLIAQSIVDCELGTPIMLALREVMGLRLAAIEAKRGVTKPCYVDESGVVWRVECGSMVATLVAIARTTDGKKLEHIAERRKVVAKVDWPLGSARAGRTAETCLSIQGLAS